MKDKIIVLLTVVLLGLGVITSIPLPVNSQNPPSRDGFSPLSSAEDGFSPEIPEDFPSGYVDPRLINCSGPTSVILAAEDSFPVEKVRKYMVSCRVTPSFGGFYLVIGVMKGGKVAPLSEAGGIVAVMKNKKVDYPVSTQMPKFSKPLSPQGFLKSEFHPENGSQTDKPKTSLRDVVDVLGANQTWQSYSVNGTDTTIAVVDTGVDYGTSSLSHSDSLARDGENGTVAFNADATCLAFTNITVEAYRRGGGTFIPTQGLDPPIYVPENPGEVYQFSEITNTSWFADMDVTGILDPGEKAHFGLMFQWLYGFDLFPVLVVDADGDGMYDTTYLDLSFDWSWIPTVYAPWPHWNVSGPPDFSFADEKRLTPKGQSLAARDFTGDGIYDLSAGVLGHLLDVWNLAPNSKDRGGMLKPIDPYGNYTCFVNDWYGHGTQCASSAAGRPNVQGSPGIAPGAQIMGVSALDMGSIIEGELWAAGFDLVPGTENWTKTPGYGTVYGTWEYTGNHKADIITNSWGTSNWTSGFMERPWYDVLSIVEDALTVPGYLHPDYPGTVIAHAAGNGGPGYGTVTEPAYASLPISVGASTSLNFSRRYGYAGGYHNEVIPWSARGPTPLGTVKPDLVSVGGYSSVPTSVWMGKGNGKNASQIFGGTSMSAPLTAGAAALVYQQRLKSQASPPTPQRTKVVLKSTAQDLGYHPSVQGSGQVDCYSAVSLVNKTEGVTVSTSATWDHVRSRINHSWQVANHSLGSPLQWDAPSPPIRDTNWFAGTLPPNGSSTAQFTVENPTSHNITATLTPVTHKRIGEPRVIQGTTRSLPEDWTPYTWGDIRKLEVDIPEEADLMTVSLNFSYHHFDPEEDYTADRELWLYIADWNDTNHNGVVNKGEVYRMNLGTSTGTTNQVQVGFPATKFKFTPVIYLRQMGNEDPIPYTLQVQFHTRKTWNWISTPSPTISLPPNSSHNFTARMTVPNGVPQGVYQGQLMVNVTGPHHTTTALPVSVNVPQVTVPDQLTYNLPPAATSPFSSLYHPYQVEGHFDWGWRCESGDWKTWLVNITDPSTVAAFVTCNWTETGTDVDLFGIDPRGVLVDQADSPYNYTGSQGPNFYRWQTTTGNTSEHLVLNTSLSARPLPGVYTVLLHNVLLDGKTFPQLVDGKLQLIKLNPRGSGSHPVNLTVRSGEMVSVPFTLATGKKLTGVEVTGWTSPISVLPTVIDEVESGQGLRFNLSAATSTGTQEGVYPATVNLTSNEIPFQVKVELRVTVDNTPPNASIIQPETQAHLKGTPQVKLEGEDDNFDRMELHIDRQLRRVWNTSGSHIFSWDTSQMPDGTHRLTLVVYDQAGNTQEASLPVTVDNTPPQASLISPSEDAHLRGDRDVQVSAFDSHLKTAEVYLDDTLMENWTTGGLHTALLDTEQYPDGSHTLKVEVEDRSGNHIQRSFPVVIDNTRPTLSITHPPPEAELFGMVDINFTAEDPNLKRAQLTIDHHTAFNVTGENSLAWNSNQTEDGMHTIQLTAYDQAGNTRETQVTVETVNVERRRESTRRRIEATRNLYLAIGIPLGALLGAVIAYLLLKNRS